MHEWFAARYGNHGRAALIHGFEALFGSQLLLENVGGVLNLSAACACQIAAEKWLKHQDKWIALAPCKLLLETYVATVQACETGTGIFTPKVQIGQGNQRLPQPFLL